MALRDELSEMTPRLRRYARALMTGSPAPCTGADDLVHATLMRAMGARMGGTRAGGGCGDLLTRLYATITQLHRDMLAVSQTAVASGAGRPTLVQSLSSPPPGMQHSRLAAGLLALRLEEREALLLVTLEGFEHDEAARILRISRPVLIDRLTQARKALECFLQARPPARRAARDVPYLRLVTGD